MPELSVIVPVFNPGSLIDECVGSLVDQSLEPTAYEIILVDDGSTDGTPARLDQLEAAHPHVHVRHIPNSGWPGRPRNVGLEMARGAYVYFVDNDDWIEREALARMYAAAVRDDADVVVGKVVGHGKPVAAALFAQNQSGVSLDWPPLAWLLTPHKLFRKSLLDAHGLRFPEGRRRLEDHVFVLSVYFRTKRVSIVADYPCYHWMLRDRDVNASAQEFEPVSYYKDLREVLDVVDEHTEPGPLRDRLYARWYQGKLLGRVGGRIMINRAPEMRRARFEQIQLLAAERFPRRIDAYLPFNFQVRSELVHRGDYETLEALAELEILLRARVTATPAPSDRLHPFARHREVRLDLEARLDDPNGLLRFRAEGGRLAWEPPERIARALTGSRLEPTYDSCKLQLHLHAGGSETAFLVPSETSARLEPDASAPACSRALLQSEVTISPCSAAAGSPLPAGDWELRATVIVAGFKHTARVRHVRSRQPMVFRVDADGNVVRLRRTGRARVAHELTRARRLLHRTVHPLTRRGSGVRHRA